MKRLFKIVCGFLALLIGISILGWCGYSLIIPNEYYRFHPTDILRLVFPVVLVWVGWRWMKGGKRKGDAGVPQITLSIKLSDENLGNEGERAEIFQLKNLLEERLQQAGLGEIDGEEFGGGKCHVFIQTRSPKGAMDLVQSVMSSTGGKWTYSAA